MNKEELRKQFDEETAYLVIECNCSEYADWLENKLLKQLQSSQSEAVVELRDALIKAKEIIKTWHGSAAWEIYDLHSPEMKPINNAIQKFKTD